MNINRFLPFNVKQLIVFQVPNLPLVLWFVGLLLAKIFHKFNIHSSFSALSATALLVWATMELFTGQSYFRRNLGAVILIFTFKGMIK